MRPESVFASTTEKMTSQITGQLVNMKSHTTHSCKCLEIIKQGKNVVSVL